MVVICGWPKFYVPGNPKVRRSPRSPLLPIPPVTIINCNNLYFKGTVCVKLTSACWTRIVLQEIIAYLGDKKLILPGGLLFFLAKLIVGGKCLASSERLEGNKSVDKVQVWLGEKTQKWLIFLQHRVPRYHRGVNRAALSPCMLCRDGDILVLCGFWQPPRRVQQNTQRAPPEYLQPASLLLFPSCSQASIAVLACTRMPAG